MEISWSTGSEWHPRIRNEKNLFIYNDLPRFIMDSYEVCRDPPRLHLLDKYGYLHPLPLFSHDKHFSWNKFVMCVCTLFWISSYFCFAFRFDAGGPGSCLQRYSDPTFFKRASGSSIEEDVEKVPRDKRTCKSKVLFTLSTIQAENLDSFESIFAMVFYWLSIHANLIY